MSRIQTFPLAYVEIMNRSRFHAIAALLFVLAAAGCNNEVVAPPDASRSDAQHSTDAGTDAGPEDAGTDAGITDGGSVLPVAAITAPSNNAFLTTATPAFVVAVTSGQADSVSVAITDGSGGTITLPATKGQDGNWSVTPTTALADGHGTATATARSDQGDSGPTSAAVAFTIDTHVPGAPTVTSPTASQVVRTLTPTFTISAGGSTTAVQVTITSNGGTPVVIAATSTGSGTWSATPANALPIGPTTVSAIATDSLGGTSPASSVISFVVDPDAPVVSITSPSNGQIVPTTIPTFQVAVTAGTAASVTVVVTDNSGLPNELTATETGTGVWTATPSAALTPGAATVTAVAVDVLGNSGGPSATVSFIVDPNVPTVQVVSPVESEVVTTGSPTIKVLVGTPSVVSVSVTLTDSTLTPRTLTATDHGNGQWEAIPTSSLAAGAATVTATATNDLGDSTTSAAIAFVVDLTAPAAPTITSPAAGAVVASATPTITVASAGTTAVVAVTLTDSAGVVVVLTATNNNDGTWSATPTNALPDGAASARAVAVDAIGGASPASATVHFVVDTHIPDAPVVLAPTAGQIVTTRTPSFKVSAGSNTTSVSLTIIPSDNLPVILNAASNGDGTWSAIASSNLPLGPATVTAVAADALGGASAPSAGVSFVVDTIIPTLELTSPTGADLVSVLKPTFVATVTFGTPTSVVITVVDSAGNATDLNATDTGSGTWSATPTTNLVFGPTVVTVVGTDYLNNSGARSAPAAIYVRGRLSAEGNSYDSFPDGSTAKEIFLNQANTSTRSPFDNATRIPASNLPGGNLPPL